MKVFVFALLFTLVSSERGVLYRSRTFRQPVVIRAANKWPDRLQQSKLNDERDSEQPIRRTRATAGITANEYDLANDNHPRGIIHWSGNYSKAVFFVTQAGNPVSQSTTWRSTDYGRTFSKDDDKFDSNAVIDNFYPCPNNKMKLIFTDVKTKRVYVTADEGTKFKHSKVLQFKPSFILFHPKLEDVVIAQDLVAHKAYVSTDLGMTWTQLAPNKANSKIYRISWGVPGVDSPEIIFFELSQDGTSAVLYQDNVTAIGGSFLQPFQGSSLHFLANSLEVVDEYMFVSVSMGNDLAMYRSYQRKSFEKAYFATEFPFKDFFVVDATEHQMFVAVYHFNNLTSVYSSDVTGRFFTLSIDNVVSASSLAWLTNNNLFVDFYRVRGIQGIYIANKLTKDGKKQSLISFNKGGSWQPLMPSKGVTCSTTICNVNLHMSYGSQQQGLQDIFTSENGIGLLMAHGNVGPFLRDEATLMVSRDAGLTWDMALQESSSNARGFDFLFGDHGSYMAATDHYQQSTYLHYSCNEGTDSKWPGIQFSNSNNLVVNGMFTEPGETTEIATVFCSRLDQHNYFQNWVVVQLNFTTLFPKKCESSDYKDWVPLEEVNNVMCLLGQRSFYQRRITDHCCYNGREYIRPEKQLYCTCTREDYECDYGYVPSSTTADKCIESKRITAYNPKNHCTEGETISVTQGYRKVSGDVCRGGDTSQWAMKQEKCVAMAPGELTLESDIEGSGVPIGRQVHFTLRQKKGFFQGIKYVWSFGDKSQLVSTLHVDNFPVVKNHSYSTAGSYKVTVNASNSVGLSTVQLVVTVYDVISTLNIIPPHAVLPTDNVTFICQPTGNTLAPIHYEWKFGNDDTSFTLTRNRTIHHVFGSTGKFLISVTAYNPVSTKSSHVYVSVYSAVRTLRLGFSRSAVKEKATLDDFDSLMADSLVNVVAQVTGYDTSRFEAFVVYPPASDQVEVDLSVVANNKNEESDIETILQWVKYAVDAHEITVVLTPQSSQIEESSLIEAISSHEVIVNPRIQPSSAKHVNSVGGETIGIIIITILAVLIIIISIIFGMWYRQRYSRLENSYFRLNQDRNVHLTLDEDDSDDDSPLALARSHDDTKATNNDDDDEDDDKLLNDV
ncbi:VPS10 domain-containing receptor SorCS2-like [Corticium candelabrum]|uniref:VPS10 domain-containing receptor SorCS2-like n=1 Tax=Corticium candelabrum TaxID=121492 RepID=UPI002E27729D|nr:VPS10 domain-containing receptor SorCS2-like [Corticium candelabrum]